MSLRTTLSRAPAIRRVTLRLLEVISFDFRARNHWSGDRLHLNLSRHKGYWFFGKAREARTMRRFAELVRPGDLVIEVGGHIGYLSQYFASLVGERGRVVVFEPGSNNLPYLERNVRHLRNARVERAAVSDTDGEAAFFEDPISGQNNSLLERYATFDSVARNHGRDNVRTKRTVDVLRLDTYCTSRNIAPDVVKIDIEGNELKALRGAGQALSKARAVMVEITENHTAVIDLLRELGFEVSDEAGRAPRAVPESGNYFASRRERRAANGA